MSIRYEIRVCALLALSGLLALCGIGLCDVVINELELSPPDNGTVWVEIYNTADASVDLTGWMINIRDGAWQGVILLNGSIEPGAFLAVDGSDSWVTSGNGTVYLYDDSGIEMDRTPQLGDDSHTDFSYGRFPDGARTDTRADFAYMMASKGRPNGSGALN